jgi:hypothetical protein
MRSRYGRISRAFGPSDVWMTRWAVRTQATVTGRVSRGSIRSWRPNASARRKGLRSRSWRASSSARRASGSGAASISRR